MRACWRSVTMPCCSLSAAATLLGLLRAGAVAEVTVRSPRDDRSASGILIFTASGCPAHT